MGLDRFVADQVLLVIAEKIDSFVANAVADACEPPQRNPGGSQRGRARRKRRGNTQCQAMDEGAIPQI